jgi:cobalamin biosynthesis protein CobD/CbiB
VSEAAFAAALGLRLGGTNRYGDRVEVRPHLGDGRPAEVDDIARVVQLSRDVTVAAGLLLVAPTLGATVLHERAERAERTERRSPSSRRRRKS